MTANSERGLAQSNGAALPDGPRNSPAFQCTECGVIESIREIEQRGLLAAASFTGVGRPAAAAASPAGF